MRKIAIINQKGGVGKTTSTANIGAALGKAGKRVLLIDLDPQAHLSLHFGVEVEEEGQRSIYDVLTAKASIGNVSMQVDEHVTLVPADIDLAGAETELISVPGREMILREAVNAVADQFDVMLIDCPPSLGVLTINALVASQEIIIPLHTQFFALQGLGRLFDTVTLVKQRMNSDLVVSGVILCMHDTTTRHAGEIVDDLVGFLDSAQGSAVPWGQAKVYKSWIRRNIKLAESSSFGQTVFDYAPRSNGAADYASLAHEVFGVTVPLEELALRASSNAEEVSSAEAVAAPEDVVATAAPGESSGEGHSGEEVREDALPAKAHSTDDTLATVSPPPLLRQSNEPQPFGVGILEYVSPTQTGSANGAISNVPPERSGGFQPFRDGVREVELRKDADATLMRGAVSATEAVVGTEAAPKETDAVHSLNEAVEGEGPGGVPASPVSPDAEPVATLVDNGRVSAPAVNPVPVNAVSQVGKPIEGTPEENQPARGDNFAMQVVAPISAGPVPMVREPIAVQAESGDVPAPASNPTPVVVPDESRLEVSVSELPNSCTPEAPMVRDTSYDGK